MDYKNIMNVILIFLIIILPFVMVFSINNNPISLEEKFCGKNNSLIITSHSFPISYCNGQAFVCDYDKKKCFWVK